MKQNQIRSWHRAVITVAWVFLINVGYAEAQDPVKGAKLFKQTCASCHSVTEKKESFHTGPALLGVTKRPGRTDQWLLEWIADPTGMLKKDALAKQLLKENKNVPMPNMLSAMNGNDPAKTKAAAADILAYLKQLDSKK